MKLTMKEHGDKIQAWLSEGRSYRQIAADLGCSKDTVNIFAKLNFPDLRRKPQEALPLVRESSPVNVLVIDIETAPNLVWAWGLHDQHTSPEMVVAPTRTLSFAAKWLGDDVIYFKSEFHNSREEMIKFAWQLLDKADIVMHYNGGQFDIPHLNREFIQLGLTPYSPIKHLDLLQTARRRFKFPSNKLAYVAPALGVGEKVPHEGFRLWLRCMNGDEDAWETMRSYNIQDVVVLEELYGKVLPWIERHPSLAAITGKDCCPTCGHEEIEEVGVYPTTTRQYPLYLCKGCGAHSRGTKSIDKTTVTGVAS